MMEGILDYRAVGVPAEGSREHHFFLVMINFLSQVKQATNQIVMNCADIDIITASYAPEGDEGRIAFLLEFLHVNPFRFWHEVLLPTVNNLIAKLHNSLISWSTPRSTN